MKRVLCILISDFPLIGAKVGHAKARTKMILDAMIGAIYVIVPLILPPFLMAILSRLNSTIGAV